MHPAYSIIFFTVLSGLGYGLAGILGLGLLDPAAIGTKSAYVISLLLVAAGLSASTLHLRNPQRAWRAFSQWRSSWLSREGVLAVITFAPMLVAGWMSIFYETHPIYVGLILTVLSALTVYSTSMIYASIRAVLAWNSPLTTAAFLLFAISGGLLLSTFFARLNGAEFGLLAFSAIVSLAAAWTIKTFWRRHLLFSPPISTPESATGLGQIGKVRLLERPHTNENYLTREMGYVIARKHAAKLAAFAVLFGGVFPVMLLSITIVLPDGFTGFVAIVLAVISHVAGMLIERWLFFAEARHAMMNYYS